MKIFDVVKARQGKNDKTYWNVVGTLFVDGEKKTLSLNMFDGVFVVKERESKEDRAKRYAKNENKTTKQETPEDIPF